MPTAVSAVRRIAGRAGLRPFHDEVGRQNTAVNAQVRVLELGDCVADISDRDKVREAVWEAALPNGNPFKRIDYAFTGNQRAVSTPNTNRAASGGDLPSARRTHGRWKEMTPRPRS
jgi:hypothetical protein